MINPQALATRSWSRLTQVLDSMTESYRWDGSTHEIGLTCTSVLLEQAMYDIKRIPENLLLQDFWVCLGVLRTTYLEANFAPKKHMKWTLLLIILLRSAGFTSKK